jgi:hypothetical protein
MPGGTGVGTIARAKGRRALDGAWTAGTDAGPADAVEGNVNSTMNNDEMRRLEFFMQSLEL